MADLPRGRVEEASGVWRPGWIDGQGRTALVSCGLCGRTLSLSEHEISPEGIVTPSVVCPFACGWHEMLTLVGWEP